MAKTKNLKEILILLRKYSQLIVDLGYAAVLEDNLELAQEAFRIKSEIKELDYQLRKEALMVARLSRSAKEGIPQIANILQIGVAIKEISDGIDDLIEIALRNVGVHPIIKIAYSRKDIRITRHEIGEGSKLDGKRVDEIKMDPESIFRIIAMRREDEWTLDPPGGKKLQGGDIIITEGRDAAVRKMQEYAKGKKEETGK
ncbi:MAG: hypothetical protein JSW49_02725 [candidate division WOR-3 bacterium]|nr:MAG: hypothetical protein JSW49_02725 [candidate division WOR-3 bacterium]